MNNQRRPKGATKRKAQAASTDLCGQLADRIIGQDEAIQTIVPYLEMYQAGLAPKGRPAGVFLLLGPTGTGKTKTVEALADVLHGSERNVLKIDCGEFQMDHEVAKLVGAPPGYLGHRETHPILTQARLAAVTSERSNVSLLLFDEIEKAAPSLGQLLLGVLDKAALRLGDNTVVNLENTFVFLTSNLGAKGMMNALAPKFGLGPAPAVPPTGKLSQIAMSAVRRHFSPEFINRIDETVTYRTLGRQSLSKILGQQFHELQQLVNERLGAAAFEIELTAGAHNFLLDEGSSGESGAREIKRTLHRQLTQPIASFLVANRIPGGCCLRAELDPVERCLRFRIVRVTVPPNVAA